MMYKLREYQQRTVDFILNNINKNIKTQLIEASTGAGKTLIASELIRILSNQNKTCFFVVANQPLIMQTYNKFKDFGINCSIIKAGMDSYYNKYSKVQIVMMQSYSARLEKLPNFQPDVIVCDEIDFGYNQGMYNKMIEKNPNSLIVGLTGTPITIKGYLLKGFDIYHRVTTIKNLQKEGFLSYDKNYVPIELDLSKVRVKSTGDYNEEDLEETCNQSYIIDDIINSYKKMDKGYKGIIFGINIKHAETIQKAFNSSGLSTGIIHSKMKKQHIKYWLDEHRKGNIRFLVNIGMVIRGYDDSEIIDLLFCRPTMSLALYLQAVGRMARPDTKGYNFFRHFDYANNIDRHGLWSEERLYEIDSIPKKEYYFEPIVCPNCFCTIFDKNTTCPECGYCLIEQQEKRERTIIEKKRVQELIEYQSTSPIYELEKIMDNANSYYYNSLRPLKPMGVSVTLFDSELKKVIKYCVKMHYKLPGSIYFKIRDKFKNCNKILTK